MTSGLVWADRERDVVRVEGPDAASFLHSQLAADIVSLDVGGSCHSMLLDPTGHLVALLRVVRQTETLFTLDVEAGHGAAVVERLRRFVLRSKLVMEATNWVVRAFRGPGAAAAVGDVGGRCAPGWPSDDEIDVVGPREALPAVPGARETEPGHIESLRVDARWPSFGVDVLAGDVPATSGVLRVAVSFTKGCYPGQELVERMDSRGAGAPVQLRVVPRGDLFPGARIEIDGRDVGTVTSVGQERAIVRVARNADIGEPIESS
ncbi:MAG: hypothetical protein RLY50_843 [Actinomycetota bacterium]